MAEQDYPPLPFDTSVNTQNDCIRHDRFPRTRLGRQVIRFGKEGVKLGSDTIPWDGYFTKKDTKLYAVVFAYNHWFSFTKD